MLLFFAAAILSVAILRCCILILLLLLLLRFNSVGEHVRNVVYFFCPTQPNPSNPLSSPFYFVTPLFSPERRNDLHNLILLPR